MKEINLPLTQTYSITIDTHSLDWRNAVDIGDGRMAIPLGSLVDEKISSALAVARSNGGKILYATTSIEQKLEGILLDFFMGPFTGHDERRSLFQREVLQSSALSFSTKRALVTKVINADSTLLSGKGKNALQDQLAKITEWRNAFAHGKVQNDSKNGCFISYYSGAPKTLKLTDDFWENVEKVFQGCDQLIDEVAKKVRAQHGDLPSTPPE